MKFPVKEPYRITQGFSSGHLGIDVAPGKPGQTGVGVYAPENGTVVGSGNNPILEGQYLVLKGKVKWYYFGHFAERKVALNQPIREGQLIGIMGKTGKATNIHTHHEVRSTRSGGQVNPIDYYKNSATVEDMPSKVDLNTGRRLYYGILGDIGALNGKRDAEIKKNYVGKDLTPKLIEGLYNSAEGKQALQDRLNQKNAVQRALDATFNKIKGVFGK